MPRASARHLIGNWRLLVTQLLICLFICRCDVTCDVMSPVLCSFLNCKDFSPLKSKVLRNILNVFTSEISFRKQNSMQLLCSGKSYKVKIGKNYFWSRKEPINIDLQRCGTWHKRTMFPIFDMPAEFNFHIDLNLWSQYCVKWDIPC